MYAIDERISKRIDKETPTVICRIGSIALFEHPIFGDESPLIAKKGDRWYTTDFWEIPGSIEEEADFMSDYRTA